MTQDDVTEARPTTKSGQALAGWNRRSQVMADTVIRIEREAVGAWLASADAEQRLAAALERHVSRDGDSVSYDLREILDELRKR